MNSFYDRDELEKFNFKSLGENVFISRKTSIYSPHKISIGDNVRIDDFCILSGEINIGRYVHIAAYCGLFAGETGIEIEEFAGLSSKVSIYAISDDYSGEFMTNPMVPMIYRKIKAAKVFIGKHSIVGAGSVVLPGAQLNEGTAIGAMSLVVRKTKPWSVYFGIPAKKIEDRKNDLLRMEKKLLINEGI
jgi:dTDP-4-amino-4,6-dideoxy-D-glucose acyltransferase